MKDELEYKAQNIAFIIVRLRQTIFRDNKIGKMRRKKLTDFRQRSLSICLQLQKHAGLTESRSTRWRKGTHTHPRVVHISRRPERPKCCNWEVAFSNGSLSHCSAVIIHNDTACLSAALSKYLLHCFLFSSSDLQNCP